MVESNHQPGKLSFHKCPCDGEEEDVVYREVPLTVTEEVLFQQHFPGATEHGVGDLVTGLA